MNIQHNTLTNKYMEHISSLTITLQVNDICGKSVLITVYNNETLIGLHRHVLSAFENCEINNLFFISETGEHIKIPVSNKSVNVFFNQYILCNPVKLKPIYPPHEPTIYCIYLVNGPYVN